MTKRRSGRIPQRGGERRRAGGRGPTPAELQALLDEIETAMLSEDQPDQVAAVVERLWSVRQHLPELLAQRLIAGQSRAPARLFDLLGLMAGPEAALYLLRIANERQADDMVRFGARRRLGWDEDDEVAERLEFLATLKDAETALVQAAIVGMSSGFPDNEILDEVIGYCQVLAPPARLALVRRLIDELDVAVVWLLRAILHIADREVQQLAIATLLERQDNAAADALERLALTTHDAALGNAARGASQSLRRVVAEDGPAAPTPLPPVYQIWMSTIDGAGGQVILIGRSWSEQAMLFINILLTDQWGIKQVLGVTAMPPTELEAMREGFADEQVPMVQVDLAAVRGALAEAVTINAATGQPIPPAFELWAPLLHDTYPATMDEPIVATRLDDAPYAGRLDLVQSSAQLAEHEFFQTWGFEPAATFEALSDVPPPTTGWTNAQYRPLIERLATPELRQRLQQRLTRMAWLLERADDPTGRDLALATAASLASGTAAQLVKHPLLRVLVERSVAQSLTIMTIDEDDEEWEDDAWEDEEEEDNAPPMIGPGPRRGR